MTQGQVWNQAAQQLPAKKKSKKGLVLAGCGGCLAVVLLMCVCGGWILYLEEGVDYDDPGEELTSVPITSGQPIALTATWNGTGYADVRAYVDLGAGAPIGAQVSGVFGCEEYGDLRMQDVRETYYGEGSSRPEGWVHIPPRYMYRRASPRPFQCAGRIELPPGVSGARLVLTTRQRPSDWLSGL